MDRDRILCRAAIRMEVRIASSSNAPEDAIVASFILLPRGRTVGNAKPGREAGRGCAPTGFPIPEAGADTAQSMRAA